MVSPAVMELPSRDGRPKLNPILNCCQHKDLKISYITSIFNGAGQSITSTVIFLRFAQL